MKRLTLLAIFFTLVFPALAGGGGPITPIDGISGILIASGAFLGYKAYKKK